MLVEAALILLAIVVFLRWREKEPSRQPPGPRWIPVIGSLEAPKSRDEFVALRAKYGDIVRYHFGVHTMITFYDYKTIKEVFSKSEVSDRPNWNAFQFLGDGGTGIVFGSGIRWQHSRRFFIKHLRDVGMGKSYMDDAILEEAQGLVDDFHKYTNRPTTFPASINVAVLNVIWQLVASRRYSLDDERILYFVNLIKEFQRRLPILMLPDIFPWLKYLPNFLFDYFKQGDFLKKKGQEAKAMMKEIVDDHRSKLDPENPQDVIDAYLLEMEAEKNNKESFFTENYLLRDIFDLFAAGFDTTSNMVRWLMLYMAAYPEVQKKVQEEIDTVVGRDALPSNGQRHKLPYLDATIYELHRCASLVEGGVFHSVNSDITVAGYLIPKGSLVAPAAAAIHLDPRYWNDPEKFLPERFIDEFGNLNVKKEGLLPFGVGKRSCLGESLVRMELFLFAAVLLQNLTFAPLENGTIDLEPMVGLPGQRFPKDQKFLIIPRSNDK